MRWAINLSSKRDYAANVVATAMNIGRKILQQGYYLEGINPVTHISPTAFSDELERGRYSLDASVKIFEVDHDNQ